MSIKLPTVAKNCTTAVVSAAAAPAKNDDD